MPEVRQAIKAGTTRDVRWRALALGRMVKAPEKAECDARRGAEFRGFDTKSPHNKARPGVGRALCEAGASGRSAAAVASATVATATAAAGAGEEGGLGLTGAAPGQGDRLATGLFKGGGRTPVGVAAVAVAMTTAAGRFRVAVG